MQGHREEMAIYKQGRQVSEETNPANTLIVDFLLSELSENKFPVFKPPSLWCFVITTSAN